MPLVHMAHGYHRHLPIYLSTYIHTETRMVKNLRVVVTVVRTKASKYLMVKKMKFCPTVIVCMA